jgi:hypothetical protein
MTVKSANDDIIGLRKPLRVRIGFLLLIVLSFRMIQTRIPPWNSWKAAGPNSDMVSRSELRFADIQKALPEYGRVGYVTDIPSDQVLANGDAAGRYFLAQYTLAPLQVINSGEEKVVVGDFKEPKGLQSVLDQTDLRIVHDFGKGVFFLQGGAK